MSSTDTNTDTRKAAADDAEEKKIAKYANLANHYIFRPLAIETTGVIGKLSSKFVAELGKHITSVTGDKRETSWLRQRLSMAILRGNAASIQATGTMTC